MIKKLVCIIVIAVFNTFPTHALAVVNAASSDNQSVLILGIIGTFITAFFALIISLINLYRDFTVNKRINYINTVTSERVKWLDTLRNNISEFCGLTHNWTRTTIDDNDDDEKKERLEKQRMEVVEKIDKLRYLIQLQLNRNDDPDKKILELIGNIPELTDISERKNLDAAMKELIRISQDLLKAEWEKVKRESKTGE